MKVPVVLFYLNVLTSHGAKLTLFGNFNFVLKSLFCMDDES